MHGLPWSCPGHGNEDGFCSNKDWLRLMDHHSQEKPWSDDRITWFGGGNINRLLSCCKMTLSALEVSERNIECLHHIDLHYSAPIMKCQEFLNFYQILHVVFPTLSSCKNSVIAPPCRGLRPPNAACRPWSEVHRHGRSERGESIVIQRLRWMSKVHPNTSYYKLGWHDSLALQFKQQVEMSICLSIYDICIYIRNIVLDKEKHFLAINP